MSPPMDSEFSNWSIPSTNHVDITGDESFCRISIGNFISRRTEALGSLSGEASVRVNFFFSLGGWKMGRTCSICTKSLAIKILNVSHPNQEVIAGNEFLC